MARLDQRLVSLGLVSTRSRARDLIRRGFVKVAGEVCEKPAQEVRDDTLIKLACETPGYVSRGGEKLAAALDRFDLQAEGRVAIDVGASTGGFTQVLLERGAACVYAVDVGRDQLSDILRADGRVRSLEGVDARALNEELVPHAVGAIVADVSFISLAKALPAALALAVPGAWLVVLVKPQFEVGRDRIGKGGVVREEAVRHMAVESVRTWLADHKGWRILGEMSSPIAGGSGNIEYLIGACRDG